MATTNDLKIAAEILGYGDDYAHYMGKYNGRFYHKGFAISYDGTPRSERKLFEILKENGCDDLGQPDQRDSLGLGAVLSWNRDRFDDADDPEKPDEEEE
jgi:hypothetical protein